VAKKVARRAKRRKAPTVSRERRRAQQQGLLAQIGAEIAQVVKAAVEGALQAEVTALLGRERYARRTTAPQERAGLPCGQCQQDWRPRLQRAGSYQRTLLTLVAAVLLRVPRISCRCGATVPLRFATLAPYQRGWADLQERARELAGLCLSLSKSREVLAWGNRQVLARTTLLRWVQQAAPLAQALRAGLLERVPAVVMLDGIWSTLLVPTGERFVDKRGRERSRMKRSKWVLLLAYGVDPTTGERWVLDWERASGEDEASWRRLLERLLARGLRTDTGLTLLLSDGSSGLEAALGQVYFGPGLLHQRCIFHVLSNVRQDIRGEAGMSRQDKQERRRQVLQEASSIWRSTDRQEVLRRKQAFCATWREREPAAVATLERHCAATLAYLSALEWARERGEVWQPRYLRATSHLERVNRSLREKLRQAGAFHSDAGLLAAVALVLLHQGLDTWEPEEDWAEALEQRLLAA